MSLSVDEPRSVHEPLSVADAFAELLCTDPNAIVACTASGTIRRAELDAKAQELAELLRGIAPGRRIALCVRDGVTFLAAFLALARRRDACLLMDASDPRAPRPDLAGRLGACAVLHDLPTLSLQPC